MGSLFLKTVPGWTISQDSAANTLQTLTRAGEAGAHYVSGFEVATQGAAIGADIVCTLSEGGTVRWRSVIGAGAARGERTGLSFTNPIRFAPGVNVVLTIAAGGAGVITSGNIEGFTL